jgi:creatinine amidohydrolase
MTFVRAVLLGVVVCLTTSAVAFAQSTSSVLSQTIAEDTYTGVERSAARGAIALWALGAIEEHGPHLPLSTDVEVPSAQLRGVRARLAGAGIQSVIVPPYYWGVNRVTGDFAGSIDIRPEVMIELMLDVFRSLHRAGFREVYCITGHFDAAHGTAIAQAVRRANDEGIVRARFVVPAFLGERLGLARDDPRFILATWPRSEPREFADLHAGEAETSAMLHIAPDRVDRQLTQTLKPTNLSPTQVTEWRRGGASARAITPDGYLGAPALASAEKGHRQLEAEAEAYAEAIRAAATAGRQR